MTDIAKAKELQKFADEFWADEQKRAEAAGMNVIEYQMQANGGMLKPTILKLLRHAKAHPKICPSDCAFQASIKKLKEQYGVK